MSLRSKIILILSGVVILYAGFDNGILRFMASRSFEAWEREEAEDRLHHVVGYIEDAQHNIDDKCRIWATWKGTRDFVHSRDRSFAEDDLGPSALEHAGVDLFFVVDADGSVIWSRIEDPASREPIKLREFPSQSLNESHPVFGLFASGDQHVAGLLMSERGPLLVSCNPIAASDVEPDGQARSAVVILGRFFDGPLRDDISRRATVAVEIASLEGAEVGDQALLDRITAAGEGQSVAQAEEDQLHLYQTLSDVRHRPTLLLRSSIERTITARGERATNYALLSALATACLILLVLLRLLQGIVISPLGKLTAHALEVGRTDDTSTRLDMQRADEIGSLATEFDRMLGRLAESRSQVVRTARLAGMSEIATGVLHNVGNVLNSVNVSSNLVRKHAFDLAVKDLEMVVDVLRQNETDLARFVAEDPRGKHLLPLLAELSQALASQRQGLIQEVESLAEGIEHIAELVRSQQTYAGKKGVFERASLREELESALKICAQSSSALHGIEVVRDYGELEQIFVDKHKLMEILINLIQNARQALADSGQERKKLILRIARHGDSAHIEVQDNGVGISQENLQRVFNHGFTTKESGHGFGLHVSANAATEMNAKLHAESDGPGHGATFVLALPMQAAGGAKAA